MIDVHLSLRRLSSKVIGVARVAGKSYCCENWILSAVIRPWAMLTSTAIAKDGTGASVGCSDAAVGGLGLRVPSRDPQPAVSVAS